MTNSDIKRKEIKIQLILLKNINNIKMINFVLNYFLFNTNL